MRLRSQSGPAPGALGELLGRKSWSLGLLGNAVDDRGRKAQSFVESVVARAAVLTYDPQTFEISLDGDRYPAEDLGALLEELAPESLLLEATTLGFVEVFLACRAQYERRPSSVSIVYAEPRDYMRPQLRQALHRRDFALSEEVENFAAVPGAAVLIRDERPLRVVLFLGYEGSRLEQLLEQTEIRPDQCVAVFGVPAFRPGWEMHSFANNVSSLRERNLREIHFAGAQDPLAAYQLLERLAAADPSGRLLLAPIGTKPHGIGVALYACAHPSNVGLIYDSPRRSTNRSKEVAVWHLHDIAL